MVAELNILPCAFEWLFVLVLPLFPSQKQPKSLLHLLIGLTFLTPVFLTMTIVPAPSKLAIFDVEDVLSKLTLHEKAELLSGAAVLQLIMRLA